MSNPTNEAEVREFFGDAKEGITPISYPWNFASRDQKMCYIEFGGDEGMRVGLTKGVQTLNDCIPEVKQATDKESCNAENTDHRGSFPGRARGGRGGFAARRFVSAGLIRGGIGRTAIVPGPLSPKR